MINSLINLFYPKVCCGCESFLLPNEQVICTRCRHEIPLTHHLSEPDNEAMKKFYGKISVEFAAAFVYYHKKGIVQEMIHNLKYRGQQDIGTIMGYWCGAELQKVIASFKVDVIVPVPLHPKKLRERGYNQVTAFGLALEEETGILYNNSLLIRKVYSKTQTRKNLLGRSEIGKPDIFDVIFSERDHNKHYLLIDDVLTTGSTLESCSEHYLKFQVLKSAFFVWRCPIHNYFFCVNMY